jgi:hypothetical protein
MHKIFFKIRAIDFKIRFNSLQFASIDRLPNPIWQRYDISPYCSGRQLDRRLCRHRRRVDSETGIQNSMRLCGEAIRLSLFRLSLSLHQEVRFLRYSVREYPVWCLKNLLSVAWSEKFNLLAICCMESLVCSSILTISPIRELHIQS